jgi:hypothetical protein
MLWCLLLGFCLILLTWILNSNKTMAAARRLQLSQMKYFTAIQNIDLLEGLARNTDLSSEQESDFMVRFRDLEKVFEAFTEMHYELQLSAKEIENFDLDDHKRMYETYNKKYYFIKQRHLGLATSNLETGSVSGNNNARSVSNRAVLPRLQIPTFSGRLEEFASFMELFRSLVDNDTSLSDTEKMYYLAGSLLGEPKTLIQHLSVTGDNYSVALELLNARYNNKRLLADRLLYNLLNIPHVHSRGLNVLKTFLNTLLENTKALEKMNFPVESWCYLLFYINFQKLDSNLKKHFEDKHADKELPTFSDLLRFLETEIRILESSAEPQTGASSAVRRSGGGQSLAVKTHAVFQNAGPTSCRLCGKSGHFIAKCEKFLAMKPTARKRQAVSLRLCFRCLNGHNIDQCKYNVNCYKCNSTKHHYLLHFDLPTAVPDQQRLMSNDISTNGRFYNATTLSANAPVVNAPLASDLSGSAGPGITGLTASHVDELSMYQRTVLLATAVVRVLDNSGCYQEARALLDGGSQSTFVSEGCVQRLGLKRFKSNMVSITGLSGAPVSGCRGAVNLTLAPRLSEQPTLVTTATVLSKITNNLPGFSLPAQLADNYRGLYLADEQFYISREIDILIGADLLCDIVLGGGCLKINDHLPRAMNTVFGHVLTGPVTFAAYNPYPQVTYFSQTFFCDTTTDQILERFWEVEDIPDKLESPKDLECEMIFKNNHRRVEGGRYQARLPFLSDAPDLGNSVPIAMKRFLAMERKLSTNESFRAKYVGFMREYLETGHMSLCDGDPQDYSSGSYLIPHHGIFKSDSDKIRVVFDASCASSNGVALNDCLHAGPKLQRDIAEIICRFRLHPYVFTTDIRMMFRQILIAEEDRRFQLIFWRESPGLPIQIYQLNTVTYGMKSSPYLAIRALRQLAEDEEANFPAAARLLRSSVYMDDILGGADTIENVTRLKQELTDLLRSGGFELSKWTSNSKEVLQDVAEEHLEKPKKIFDNADGPSFFKILGIQWDSSSDCFSYRTKLDDTSGCTKRLILSILARTFDPLGWISPIVFQGKVLMQQLWLKNLSWDAEASADVISEWQGILKDLPLISSLRLERFVLAGVKTCSLHGFSDASELGYGAAVYLRTVGQDGEVKVSLMMAKSRVAPIKSKLTIPKLELSGATLLVRLLKYVVAAISDDMKIDSIVGWSDSTIILSWLRVSPHLLQTFEGNRVSQIINCGLDITWRHLPSEMNPADVASRGCRASVLLEHPLWWGPGWLTGDADTWPKNIMDKAEDPLPGLRKGKVNVGALVGIVDKDNIFTRFSSLNMLLAVVAYCFRFVNNSKSSSQKLVGGLTVAERQLALQRLIKLVQEAEFGDDIHCLVQNKQCSTRLRRLRPYIGDDGLLRVGGRLEHSSLSFERKHPVILPKSHALTVLIVDHFHVMYCHAGATVLMGVLQRQFWIISAAQVIRTRIFKCIQCFRTKARPTAPLMAALPWDRVNATGVFHTVQTDFAGPFMIKHSRLRNAKILKAYLCVFICSASKGVHLECVTDLSTEGFLAALTRFTSRRGMPSVIRSDCGTNYVGASRYLDDVQKYLASQEAQQRLSDGAAKRSITWRFNSPAAPHFGGLFEATVKSAKTLLRRVIGDQVLTFDELVTVFTKVEAVLNCRPLCPLTQDPQEIEVLTPAHLLIGRALLSVPEYNFEDVPSSRLKRFNLVQAMSQHFWRKWSDQYLHSLQMRRKWTSTTDPPKLGDLVLIKEENLPPLKWRLGRIEVLLPGKDGIVRVVQLRTTSGTLMRPVVKICRLPLDD